VMFVTVKSCLSGLHGGEWSGLSNNSKGSGNCKMVVILFVYWSAYQHQDANDNNNNDDDDNLLLLLL
jgi:hypothetical protein